MHRLGWRGCAALAALAIVSSVVLSATSATASTGCHYDLALRQWVCQAVSSPGLSPHAQNETAARSICVFMARQGVSVS